jgi:hypothetical protein
MESSSSFTQELLFFSNNISLILLQVHTDNCRQNSTVELDAEILSQKKQVVEPKQ